MTHSQEALSAFSTPDTPVQAEQQKQAQPANQQNQKTRQNNCSESPLTDLYGDIKAHIEDTYPAYLQEQDITTPINPESQQYRTNGIPTAVKALPDTVGQWKLATYSDTHVSYLTDSAAYDSRYGEGGALYRFKLVHNNRGANRDDKYHLRTETVVGYTNGSKIRSHTPTDESPMLGIRGHNVRKNRGDSAVLGGTKQKFGEMREGIVNLIALLHHTPTPVKNYLPSDGVTDWSTVKYGPTTCIWEAPAPSSVPKDHLKLKLLNNQLTLVAYNEEDSLPDRDRATAPILESKLPPAIGPCLSSNSAYITTPSILAADKLLTEDIATVISKSDITTTEA